MKNLILSAKKYTGNDFAERDIYEENPFARCKNHLQKTHRIRLIEKGFFHKNVPLKNSENGVNTPKAFVLRFAHDAFSPAPKKLIELG